MRQLNLSLPELGLVAMTRAAGGVGLGLLLAGRLSNEQRKALGWGLLALGAATTIPLAAEILGHSRSCAASRAEREEEWAPTRA
jgi:hypothetical protein